MSRDDRNQSGPSEFMGNDREQEVEEDTADGEPRPADSSGAAGPKPYGRAPGPDREPSFTRPAATPPPGGAEAPSFERETVGGNAYQTSESSLADNATPDQAEPAIIIGPTRSGKTYLLLAIGRACHMRLPDGLGLEFIPTESVAKLMEKSDRIIAGEEHLETTVEGRDYHFEIHAQARIPDRWGRTRRRQASLAITVSDGPGGALFPEDSGFDDMPANREHWHRYLVDKAQQASSLIFCVDATYPQSDLLETRLPRLISRMATSRTHVRHETSSPLSVSRLFRRQSAEPVTYSKRSLNVDRFLLLINKVDRFCAHCPDPQRFASMIDPVEQAREFYGIAFLSMIQAALKPTATFAIGLTSALGFHPENGMPLADDTGTVRRSVSETRDEILRRWRPFGVRDALRYIATGHATGTVKLVTTQDLIDDERNSVEVYRSR